MEPFYATGLLFFTWPMVTLTILAEYVWAVLSFALSLRFAGVENRRSALKSRFFAVFVASFGADALLAVAVLLLLTVAQSSAALTAWLEHPFVGAGGTLAALGCLLLVALCGLLKWALYRNIVFGKLQGVSARQRKTLATVLAILTTPWLFILPTATVGAVMGEMMVALGGIAGVPAPESLLPVITPIP